MIRPSDISNVFRLAWHINKHLPPKDGEYHAVAFNIRLKPRKTTTPDHQRGEIE